MNLDEKIIAYALKERRISLKLKSFITPDYLHNDYKSFYEIFISYFENFKEVPTLKVFKEYSGENWKEEFRNIYSNSTTLEVDEREFNYDIEKLKQRYNADLLIQVGKLIYKDNLSNGEFKSLKEANIAIKKLSASIDSISNKRIYKEGSLASTAQESLKDYLMRKENPEIAKGVRLGFREFDRITNGLQKSELMLIGGESSAGKSALAMQMGINAWLGSNKVPEDIEKVYPENFINDGANVLFFTIEMPFSPLRRRIDACIAGVSLNGLRDASLTEEEFKRYEASIKFQEFYKKQFHIVDIPRGCTIEQIESKYLELIYEHEIDLIVIDYLTLMESKKDVDWLSLGENAEKIHEFARTYEVPIISPVQLNRPEKNKGREEETPDANQHRIGRSIMLVQNSNIILNIRSRKDEHLKPDMQVQVAKMRDGEKTVFILHKRLDMMRIYDDIPDWSPEVYDSYGE